MGQTDAGDKEEKKKKKAGLFLRWFGKGGRTQGMPLTGGAAQGGRAVSGGLSSAASSASVAPQLLAGSLGGAGRMGLAATLGSFFGSPAGFILLLAGVAVAAGATAMYFADRSSSNQKYAAQFSVSGEGAENGYEARGSAASGVPAAGYADGEQEDEPVQAGSLAEDGSGEQADSGAASPDMQLPGQSPQGEDQAKPGSAMEGEFAKQFGKAGGLASAAQTAFTMGGAGGKDSASTALASGASAVASRGAAARTGFGRMAALNNRSRGASGSHAARSGSGGRSKSAWAQAGVVKTSLEGAASSAGEAGSVQASNTWDGGASGGGSATGGGSDGGGSSSVSMPETSAAGIDASVSGAGGGADVGEVGEPGLEEQSYMENLETPFLKNTQAVTTWTMVGSVALGIFAALWKAFQANPEPITKAILLVAIVAAVATIVASIGVVLYNAITLWSQYGQAAEGIAGIASAAALVAGVITCFAGGGMKYVVGFAALAPMIPMLASPLLKAVFGS